jgi:hypothetical protein
MFEGQKWRVNLAGEMDNDRFGGKCFCCDIVVDSEIFDLFVQIQTETNEDLSPNIDDPNLMDDFIWN